MGASCLETSHRSTDIISRIFYAEPMCLLTTVADGKLICSSVFTCCTAYTWEPDAGCFLPCSLYLGRLYTNWEYFHVFNASSEAQSFEPLLCMIPGLLMLQKRPLAAS